MRVVSSSDQDLSLTGPGGIAFVVLIPGRLTIVFELYFGAFSGDQNMARSGGFTVLSVLSAVKLISLPRVRR